MVFANLPAHEKDAFFALLDEYFESRPEIFSAVGASGATSDDPRTAAASVVGRAIANNPAAAANFGKRALAASQGTKPAFSQQNAESAQSDQQEQRSGNSFGRVAAASMAFANRGQASPGPPPLPPNRANSTASASSTGDPPAAPPRRSPSQKPESGGIGLVSRRTMGNIDTTSKMNALTSAFGKAPTTTRAAAPPAPAAFPARKNTMPPPPTRRVPSSDSVSSTPPPPARRAAPEPEPEPEQAGEWADVLYDYSSNDPGDLNVKEGQQILIIERTSDDWWTGEVNGKSGLVPASYLKVL